MNHFFKSVVTKSSLYYTVIVSLFSFIVLISNTSEESLAVDPARILWFLPFCICFGIANTVLKYKEVGALTRWSVHFVLTVAGAFLFIILPADLDAGSGNFMGMFFVLAIYFIGVLFSAILTSRIKKSIKQDNELKSKTKRSHI